jgi:hypothetical protein
MSGRWRRASGSRWRAQPVRSCLLGSSLLLASACSVGSGEGFVRSELLRVRDCYEGRFELNPNFFAANPFEETLTIRIQRGEQDIQVSDGLTLLVNDVPSARARLGEDLTLGLPVGVSPLGFPLPDVPNPPDASLSLYLNNSCRSQNSLLMAYDGRVTFINLFSGDLNEENSVDRITEGTLWARVIDPRDAVPGDPNQPGPAFTFPEERSSLIDASFKFVFHRGTPAQPFP